MVIDLTGVLQDGTNRNVLVPYDARVALSVPQYQPATIRLKVVGRTGAPVPVGNWDAKLVVGKNGQAVITIVGTVDAARGPGCWNFALTREHTRTLQPSTFGYDVWLLDKTSPTTFRECIVPTSQFNLKPSVAGATP